MAFTPPKWGVSSYNPTSLATVPADPVSQSAGYSKAIDGANIVPANVNPNLQVQRNKAQAQNSQATAQSVLSSESNQNAQAQSNPPAQRQRHPESQAAQSSVSHIPPEKPQLMQQAESFRANAPELSLEDLPIISPKITKVNALKKVIDFNDKLIMARVEDYANIHGRGGKGHNGNSTIGVIICDYTKGKGDNSVTLSYNIDVSSIALLLEAGLNARQGLLKYDSPIGSGWTEKCLSIVDGWARIPIAQDGTRPIHRNELNALHGILDQARTEMKAALGTPVFNYSREKNNPYAKGADGFVPVSRIDINYSPYRQDGSKSNYPWYIGIKNFEAPLNTSSNGANTHLSTKARNVKTAFINLSADDFCESMTEISSLIRVWELQALPLMKKAYQLRDLRKQLSGNKK